MKYLLHGDDTASSRKFYLSLTESYQVTSLEGKNLLVKDLEEKLVSTSLFDENKAVVIENLLSKNVKKKDFVNFLNDEKSQTLTILWEDKRLPKTSYRSLKDVSVRDFLLPQNYFQFLDSFAPKNGNKLFKMYHELLLTMSAELVFYSLIKRVRLLVVLANGSTISELSKMAPWQVGKLKSQLRLWKKDELLSFFKNLADTEIEMKTGKLPLGLSKHLDILILTQLI